MSTHNATFEALKKINPKAAAIFKRALDARMEEAAAAAAAAVENAPEAPAESDAPEAP